MRWLAGRVTEAKWVMGECFTPVCGIWWPIYVIFVSVGCQMSARHRVNHIGLILRWPEIELCNGMLSLHVLLRVPKGIVLKMAINKKKSVR